MDNNDILVRIRYALDIKDSDIIKIFQLGGIEITKEDVQRLLIKPKDDAIDIENKSRTQEFGVGMKKCNNFMLESFLNGLIIFNRGVQQTDLEQPAKPVLSIINSASVNNVMLKKMKIALALSSEDMLEILEEAGLTISKGELSAVFRKEGHKNYKECGDSYAKNFLKGLALRYRK